MTAGDRSTADAADRSGAEASDIAVWDPLMRAGHWLLVIAFAAAYLSAEEETGGPDALHVWSGAVIGMVVALRTVWGFVGSRHARFADFLYGPGAVLRYLVRLPLGQARRYLGHSPGGGAMVVLLLGALAATAITGVAAYLVPGQGGQDTALGELHGAVANIALGLVILHVCGVVLASYVHRENLVWAMITGKKRG
jgi:cytochrome b